MMSYTTDRKKDKLLAMPITLFCIHGNHDKRPQNVSGYKKKSWHGGGVWVDDRYPNQLFAEDGEVFNLGGKQTLVVGGAYSVDKNLRLEHGWPWFADEQPDDNTKLKVEGVLHNRGWCIDVMLTHTVPYCYQPFDMFLSDVDQSTVDSSTEIWLENLEVAMNYEKWYGGHFHCDRQNDKIELMYEKVKIFGEDIEIKLDPELSHSVY